VVLRISFCKTIIFTEVITIAAQKSTKTQYRINEDIKVPEIRLIGSDGIVVGIMPVEEALKLSQAAGLDLVEISPNATPPVCKIIDYGKFMFEITKREKEAKKKQKTVELKEVWLKMGIDEHDINFKIKNACKFLEEGDKVKVSLSFRGREMTRTQMGAEVLDKFTQACSEYGTAEKAPKLEGRHMIVILAPKK
jgi:translation initiation factor IF-3